MLAFGTVNVIVVAAVCTAVHAIGAPVAVTCAFATTIHVPVGEAVMGMLRYPAGFVVPECVPAMCPAFGSAAFAVAFAVFAVDCAALAAAATVAAADSTCPVVCLLRW